MQRWSLLLTCNKQPLLDVDHTDARLNLLTPRFVSQKGRALPASTLEKKRLKYENKANRQYLIPEILDIHPIPGKTHTNGKHYITTFCSVILAKSCMSAINSAPYQLPSCC